MSYGILTRNIYGEDVLDEDNACYFVVDSGVTRLWSDIFPEGQTAASAYTYKLLLRGLTSTGPNLTQIASSATGTFTEVIGPTTKAVVHPVLLPYNNALAFYELGSTDILIGQNYFLTDYSDATPTGFFGEVVTASNAAVNYKIVAPHLIGGYSETKGLAVFNSSGQKIFDNREELFAIHDHFYVHKDIAYNILTYGAKYRIKLRKPLPDMWVAPTNHNSFWHDAANDYRRTVGIKKIDNSTVELYQYSVSSPVTVDRLWIVDSTLLFGN